MIALSAIVVSWNAKRYVHECLTSLCNQNLNVDFEIVLVDNASSDGTPEMVRRDFPQVTVIDNSRNFGFAKANNIGIEAARGRYIALINSDVNVPASCLQRLYTFLEHSPAVGVVGPRMLTADGHFGRSYMRFPNIWNCLCTALCLNSLHNGKLFGGVLMTDFDGQRTIDVDVLNGWFLMLRREALETVGLLDERFFMYGEDVDWSYRFYKAGWRRVYFAGASALHYGGASSSRAAAKFYVQMHKANFQYWKKHHSALGVVGYWLTTLTHHSLRLIGYLLVYLFTRGGHLDALAKFQRSASCIVWLLTSRSEGARLRS